MLDEVGHMLLISSLQCVEKLATLFFGNEQLQQNVVSLENRFLSTNVAALSGVENLVV